MAWFSPGISKTGPLAIVFGEGREIGQDNRLDDPESRRFPFLERYARRRGPPIISPCRWFVYRPASVHASSWTTKSNLAVSSDEQLAAFESAGVPPLTRDDRDRQT